MRRWNLGFVTAVLALVSMSGSIAGAAPAQSHTYVAGTGDSNEVLAFLGGQGAALPQGWWVVCGEPGIGGACFSVPAATTQLDVSLHDALGIAVVGQGFFFDALGTRVEAAGFPRTGFCQTASFDVPANAATFIVTPNVVDRTLAGPCVTATSATGRIDVVFR